MGIDGATYTTGTATVAAGGTAVTGTGTDWLTAGLKPGDQFSANGLSVTIATVNSNTSLTLVAGWPGAALNAAAYEIRFVDAASRALAKTIELLDQLGNGNIGSLADLQTAANKLAYYTGAGSTALTDLTAFGRALLNLGGGNGKFIRGTGAGSAAVADIVGTVSQSGGIPTGAIVERGSNANGDYGRFADGTQICTFKVSLGSILAVGAGTRDNPYMTNPAYQWTFPAAFALTPVVVGRSIYPSEAGAAPDRQFAQALIGRCNAVAGFQIRAIRMTGNSTADVFEVDLAAVGRWY